MELSTACPHALLSKCNACIFRRRSDANLRTANRSSQLDVAREEQRGRCSFLQQRQGLLDERTVSLGCFCRERRRERAVCRCNANRFGSCRWSQLPRTWKTERDGRPSATTGRQWTRGSVRVRERRRVFWKSPFAPTGEVGRVPRPLCRTALSAETSVTRYRAEQCERAAELRRSTVERFGSRCRGAAREARRVNSSRTTGSLDDRDQ